MNVPEKLINFRVYEDSDDLIGIADVELPSLEAMTETVKGAGIAGEVESPVLGHYGSMEVVLNWRVLAKKGLVIAKQTGLALDIRGSIQVYDSSAAVYETVPVKVVVRGIPKRTELGKLDAGATMDASNTVEAYYLKVTIDGDEVIEIDKYNFIAKIDGTDYLAPVKEDLGLA